MRKIHIVIIVAIASILAVLMQTLFGNFLSAKLATLPIFRNLDLFNPRAPIVVNNKETVRVSDANDAVETADSVKSKLSIVVYYDGKGADTKLVRSGGAVNWTADGYFVTTASALALPNKTYAVILSNGEIYPIKNVFSDKAYSTNTTIKKNPSNINEQSIGQVKTQTLTNILHQQNFQKKFEVRLQ